MTATTDENEEQGDELDEKIDDALEKIDRVDEAASQSDDGLDGFPEHDKEVIDEVTGNLFPFAEYELEVGRTTATDEHTDEQYTLWRAQGRPIGTTTDGFTEVSPNLAEAVMGVCESLRRNGDGL